MPHCLTILGVSNVSFGLPPRGREVLNAVFLYHCTKAGLDYAIVNTEKGVVLIDEFETGLHTSVMEKAFSFSIESALKSEVQLFMTTHSLEAVDKLLESSEQYAKDIRIIRLRKKNGKVFVRSGAGIVADSVPEKEYEECINKAKAVLSALKMAEEADI